MATLQEFGSGWHVGEEAMHKLLNGHAHGPNPTSSGLPMPYAYRILSCPLVAFGALDPKGRPWTTVWGGERKFARPMGHNMLAVQTFADLDYDPVVSALFGGNGSPDGKGGPPGDGELLKPGPEHGPVMSALSIDLEKRGRVKLAGRMVAGAATTVPSPDAEAVENDPTQIVNKDKANSTETEGRVGDVQLAMLVEETLGNCPKYLNKKAIRPHVPKPRLLFDSETDPLPQEALDLIDTADLFFLSSTNGKTMDTNHRGGPPGFVRVAKNTDSAHDGIVLVYPEFSGNRLYQTLGNLHIKPLVGITIPDFDNGNVLYLTGHTRILVGADAAAYLPHTKLAIHISVDSARLVADSLPFRGSFIDHSPYNPPVRRLASEIAADGGVAEDGVNHKPIAMVKLTGRKELSPTIARFTFSLETQNNSKNNPLPTWTAGQHVTLNFGDELDNGWSHMCEHDPQSLNDDYVRTFTVSSPPPAIDGHSSRTNVKMELTLRKHGPVTEFLWRQNVRAGLQVPVLAFGGEEKFRIDVSGKQNGEDAIFIAAGVGVTPVLAQAPGLLVAPDSSPSWKLLWSLRKEDAALATDSFARIPGLAKHTTLFLTGNLKIEKEKYHKAVQEANKAGATVVEGRRIQKEDLINEKEEADKNGSKFYLCTGTAQLRELQQWLVGRNVVWESFEY